MTIIVESSFRKYNDEVSASLTGSRGVTALPSCFYVIHLLQVGTSLRWRITDLSNGGRHKPGGTGVSKALLAFGPQATIALCDTQPWHRRIYPDMSKKAKTAHHSWPCGEISVRYMRCSISLSAFSPIPQLCMFLHGWSGFLPPNCSV
jgi:hypothetical protein